MPKPTVLPLWDTAEERVLEPSITQKTTGWVYSGSIFEKPDAETFNHWMNNVYRWLKYFDEEVVPSSPIATYEEYTATGGETFITTTSNTDIQVYKNGTFLIKDTDYTLNVDGVTVDFVVALNVSDFVQWYDLRKLERSYINRDINGLTDKTTPVVTDNLVIQEAGGDLKKLSLNNLTAALKTNLLHIQDQKPLGTNGGNFTPGLTWIPRVLNTILVNDISGASLSSNQITLPAGEYLIDASCPVHRVSDAKLRLRNITDSTTIIEGRNAYNYFNVNISQSDCKMNGRFTLNNTKTIEIQNICSASNILGNGFGVAGNLGTQEIYSDVKIWKVG